MNIGVDIRCLMSPIRTGVAEYAHELLNAVFAIDHHNTYFLFYNSHVDVSRYIPQWNFPNVHYIHTRWPNKLFNASLAFFGRPRLDQVVIRNSKLEIRNLDVFFSPNLNFITLSPHTRHILTIHDLSFKLYPDFFSYKRQLWHHSIAPRTQCRQAQSIIVPSENTKRDVIDRYGIDEKKVRVIYPGIDCHSEPCARPYRTSTFGREESLSDSRKDLSPDSVGIGMTTEKVRHIYNLPERFILFLGTIEPRKNIIGLIEAFEKAYPQLPVPYSLVIAGSKGWNDKRIYEKASRSPLKDRIHFIGYIDPMDKPSPYSLARLFVYPSFYEGFGFPVIEAMSCGVPVITSNRSSLPEITEGAAYLINPNNSASIAEGMVKILNNTQVSESLRSKGLAQAQRFTWEHAARQWLGLLPHS